MGKIFYICGKSSSGKDTVYKMIQEEIPDLKTIVLYTTRPIREGEREGVEYYFVDENKVKELEDARKIIELRTYKTVHGNWKYFTVDDHQVDLSNKNYLVIGTLESFQKMMEYYGETHLVPLYIELEDGERLMRAIMREREQAQPRYEELCRRFLADAEDFSEENIRRAGIKRRFQNPDSRLCAKELEEYIKESWYL